MVDITERNNKLQRINKAATGEVTYVQIAQRTGGILEPLLPEDILLVERVKDGLSGARITDIEAVSAYIEVNTAQQTRRKLIEVTEQEFVTIDLSPYKLYSKFIIQFLSFRTIPNISISIEGLNDLKYGLESIIMAGIDSNTDYLPSDKRGTISFTLDSTDYEFPSSIYHFGGFFTGGTPASIFLQIDYIEVDTSSPEKYKAEHAIYADVGKAECELWSINSTPDSNNHEYITPFKENTTLIFKTNGNYLSDNYYATSSNQAIIQMRINLQNMLGSEHTYVQEHIYIPNMPIIKPTGFLSINAKMSMLTYTTLESGVSTGSSYLYSTMRSYANGDSTTIFNMSELRTECINPNIWTDGIIPTDFGLYRVIVKGRFAQNQLNN